MKNKKVKNLLNFIILIGVLYFPSIIFAQTPQGGCAPNGGKLCNPLSSIDNLPAFIQKFLEGIIKIGIPVVALAIVYSGFLFVSARGKPEELTKAKNALLYTVVGTAILFGSWAIAKLISETVLAL